MKVSVCIPTYNRPELLKEAFLSCISQTEPPYEIVIGDDSKNEDSISVITSLQQEYKINNIKVVYNKNTPSLGQRDNVNKLVELAAGDKFVLLHDDDLLMPDALASMKGCFERDSEVKVVYGNQYIIDNDGQIDLPSSAVLNSSFYRTEKFEKIQLRSIDAAIVQQFPNDGYMIDMAVVKRIKYASKENEHVGTAVDFDFGVRLAMAGCKFHYINQYTAKYRITTVSIERGGSDAAYKAFQILESLTYKPEANSQNYKQLMLKEKAASAVVVALKYEGTKEAIRIYFSEWHRKSILSLGGLKRGLQIIFNIKRQKRIQ